MLTSDLCLGAGLHGLPLFSSVKSRPGLGCCPNFLGRLSLFLGKAVWLPNSLPAADPYAAGTVSARGSCLPWGSREQVWSLSPPVRPSWGLCHSCPNSLWGPAQVQS